MNAIVDYMHGFDPSKKVLLLIGRDLPEAHHVLDQRTGPPRSTFAQRSPLGWPIIDYVCLSGHHLPSTHNVNKTFMWDNGRPTTLEPCQQVVSIDDSAVSVFKTQVTKSDIVQTTPDDNKPGLSIEDREFLNIMNNKFRLNSEGKWIAPLPFQTGKDLIPDNYELALHRAP